MGEREEEAGRGGEGRGREGRGAEQRRGEGRVEEERRKIRGRRGWIGMGEGKGKGDKGREGRLRGGRDEVEGYGRGVLCPPSTPQAAPTNDSRFSLPRHGIDSAYDHFQARVPHA